jgi:hypothetical protein
MDIIIIWIFYFNQLYFFFFIILKSYISIVFIIIINMKYIMILWIIYFFVFWFTTLILNKLSFYINIGEKDELKLSELVSFKYFISLVLKIYRRLIILFGPVFFYFSVELFYKKL